MTLAIDFDGTIVEHRYPEIGRERPFAIRTLLQLQKEHHILILWTVREGKLLQDAIDFCRERGLEFYAVNSNYPGEKRDATTATTDSLSPSEAPAELRHPSPVREGDNASERLSSSTAGEISPSLTGEGCQGTVGSPDGERLIPSCRKLTADYYIDDRNIGKLPDWGVIYDIVHNHRSFESYYQQLFSQAAPEKKSFFARLFGK